MSGQHDDVQPATLKDALDTIRGVNARLDAAKDADAATQAEAFAAELVTFVAVAAVIDGAADSALKAEVTSELQAIMVLLRQAAAPPSADLGDIARKMQAVIEYLTDRGVMRREIVHFKVQSPGRPDPRMWVQQTTTGGGELSIGIGVEELDVLMRHMDEARAGRARLAGLQGIVTDVLGWDTTEDEDAMLWEFANATVDVEPPAELSERAQRMALMPRTLVLENRIARNPLELVPATNTLLLRGKLATGSHKVATALLSKVWAENGYRADLIVDVDFARFNHVLAYADKGGWQYARIRNLVRELHGAIIGAEWSEDGALVDAGYSVIQAHRVTSADGGRVTVRLGQDFAKSIRDLDCTFLDEEKVRALRKASPRSDTALLLWMWLESERLPWTWRVFPVPEGEKTPPTTRGVAIRLGLLGESRKQVVRAIRKAAGVVMAVVPSYVIEVTPADGRGMYNLTASRRAFLPSSGPVDNSKDAGATVYERIPGACTNAYPNGVRTHTPATSAEANEVPANHELAAEPTNMMSFSSSFSSSFEDQSQEHTGDVQQQNEQGPEQEMWSGERICALSLLTDRAFNICDGGIAEEVQADFVASIGGDFRLLEAVCVTVCQQYRRASGGAVCRGNCGLKIDAAEFDAAGNVEWCPAWDAARDVRIHLANYIAKNKMTPVDASHYVRRCIKNAVTDPHEMMGRTRSDRKEAYRQMTALYEATADQRGDQRPDLTVPYPRVTPPVFKGKPIT